MNCSLEPQSASLLQVTCEAKRKEEEQDELRDKAPSLPPFNGKGKKGDRESVTYPFLDSLPYGQIFPQKRRLSVLVAKHN